MNNNIVDINKKKKDKFEEEFTYRLTNTLREINIYIAYKARIMFFISVLSEEDLDFLRVIDEDSATRCIMKSYAA